MTKYILDMSEKGYFVVFEQDENGEDIDWFSQGDLDEYKKWDHAEERIKKYEDVINWMKIKYPELLI